MVDPILVEQLDEAIATALKAGSAEGVLQDLLLLPDERFKLRLRQSLERRAPMTTTAPVREGFTTVTPYIMVEDGEALIQFLTATFGAKEVLRNPSGPGRFHAELQIGESMLMMSSTGGVFPERKAALHVYVEDCDAAFARAIAAGAKSLGEPADRPYGERSGFVEDPKGNIYYIATRAASNPAPPGVRSIVPYLHPAKVRPYIEFLKQAFGAEPMEIFEEDGRVVHAAVRIGDAVIEMGEAHEEVPRGTFYLYVPNVDEVYERAVAAGAKGTRPPTNQSYAHREAEVVDPAGYIWYPSTPI